jgi:hypothetical protein
MTIEISWYKGALGLRQRDANSRWAGLMLLCFGMLFVASFAFRFKNEAFHQIGWGVAIFCSVFIALILLLGLFSLFGPHTTAMVLEDESRILLAKCRFGQVTGVESLAFDDISRIYILTSSTT